MNLEAGGPRVPKNQAGQTPQSRGASADGGGRGEGANRKEMKEEKQMIEASGGWGPRGP